jgi:A/G-specific adenine glycosylase
MSSPAKIHAALLTWYKKNARMLPWRRNQDPYLIWLSEIMLQQTRVETVIPYFEKFLARYPDVEALAKADIDELRGLWAGLGYYTRVMNLKRAAELIVSEHQGKFPRTSKELIELPGIGPYTSAAIASIAFQENIAAIDGNLDRVFSRILALPKIAKGAAEIDRIANEVVARGQAGSINQALMDLASVLCLPKNPKCTQCPLASECSAHHLGKSEAFPIRALKKTKVNIDAKAYLFFSTDHDRKPQKVFLARRPKGAWLAGQWDIPWWITGQDKGPSSGQVKPIGKVEVRRVITHHKINFHVEIGLVRNKKENLSFEMSMQKFNADFRWAELAEIEALPRPTRKAIDKALRILK